MKFKDRINYLLAAYELRAYAPKSCGQKQTYLDDFYPNEAAI